MAKEKVKVEEVQTEPDVKVEKAKVKMAFVILVDENGNIQVQDGKQIFGEEQIELEANEAALAQVVKTLHTQLEVAELVAKVKAELAKSFVGGTN